MRPGPNNKDGNGEGTGISESGSRAVYMNGVNPILSGTGGGNHSGLHKPAGLLRTRGPMFIDSTRLLCRVVAVCEAFANVLRSHLLNIGFDPTICNIGLMFWLNPAPPHIDPLRPDDSDQNRRVGSVILGPYFGSDDSAQCSPAPSIRTFISKSLRSNDL
jgi:hypothetical protein